MAATLARPQPSYHDSPRHEQRSTSSPAPGATPRNGYANSFQAESPYNGTPRSITPASPAPNGTTITLPALLAMHDQDPHSALSSLVEAYNALASSASPSSVLQSERDKFATENTKLWSWCSNLKRERDALSKEQKETRNRLVELETLLRGAGLPVPPSRSMSTSPVDELNVPTRPVGPRSYSDGPGSSSRERTPSHETGRRRAGTNASVSAPSTQTGIGVAASPAPSSSLPLQTVSEIATTLTTASPPPISPSASSTGPPPSRHLTRKASSLDLGRKGTLGVNDPAKTPLATRSLTPPPISTSPSMHQDAIIPSGQSAPGTPPPDRARCVSPSF